MAILLNLVKYVTVVASYYPDAPLINIPLASNYHLLCGPRSMQTEGALLVWSVNKQYVHIQNPCVSLSHRSLTMSTTQQ